VSNRDGVFRAGLDYWHTGPSHLLNLKLALMLFARYTIAQACWCIRPWAMPDSCRCSEEQELARPLKREPSCTALTPQGGNSLPELCTGSWSCPALDLHLELGSRWLQCIFSSGYEPHGLSISLHMDRNQSNFYSLMATCLLP